MNTAFSESPSDRYVNALNRLIDGNDWPRVLQTSRAWLAEDPENGHAHRAAAQALINLERYAEARPHVEKALAAYPYHSFSHRLASIMAFHLKEFTRADEHIQRALELAPNDPQNWHHLASMRYQHGALDIAAKHARRALELQPDNPHLINLLALCERGDKASQLASYHRALELDPENSAVHNNLGVYYLNVAEDYPRAEACFREALRLDPTDQTPQKNLLLVLRHNDRVYRALRSPLAFVEKFAINGPNRDTLGRVGLVIVGLLFGKFLWMILILWALLLYPLQKAYEYLTIGDIQAQAGVVGARQGGLWGYRRWPLGVRFGLLAGLAVGFWGAVYLAVRQANGFTPANIGFGISLVALGFWILFFLRKGHSSRLRWLARRNDKRLSRRLEENDNRPRF